MSTSALLGGRGSILFKAFNTTFLGVPGWLDRKFAAPETEGPRLGDLSVQTSTYGAEIGHVHGTIALAGNLIWLENNKLKETVHKKKSGGKGGASTTPTRTFSYSATFIIAICEGPIDGIARIWCGDKLIYNAASGDLATIIASNKSARGFKIYYGTDDQLPDPRYEAAKGVGKASAFRGLAYVVFEDFQLADYGNTLQAAEFKFEIVQVSDYESVRRISGALTPIQFASGLGEGAGVPYLASAQGSINVTTATGDQYMFSLECAYLGPFGGGAVIPPDTSARRYVGFMESELVYVNLNNLGFSFGERAVIYPDQLQENIPPGEFLHGCTVSEDGQSMLIITGPGPGFVGAALGDKFYVIDPSGDLVNSGAVAEPTALSMLGLGRRSNSFTSSCMENDREHVWSAYGAGEAPVTLYRINGSELSVVRRLRAAMLDSFFTQPSVLAKDGVAYVVSGSSVQTFTRQDQIIEQPPTLAEVIESEVLRSGLITGGDIDVSGLEPVVKGYAVQGGTIRSAIEPLQRAFRFDVVQSGYVARFLPRGGKPVATIPYLSLISDGSNSSDVLLEEREMYTELPVRTTVKYIDAPREYSVSNQTFERLSAKAVGKQDLEVPIVLTATEALQLAEIMTLLPWLERSSFSFKLPPIYQGLEPGDVIVIPAPWATVELRLDKVDYGQDGTLQCEGMPNRSTLYTSQAVANEPPAPISTIPVTGPTLFVPMDIPVISENQQNFPGFIGAVVGYTPGWNGALLVQSQDEGQTWSDLQGFVGPSTIGVAANTLPASASTVIDERALSVRMISGQLESITRDQMLVGRHYVAYGVDGRWEIVRFQSAELQADGTYSVSRFVRGERGTEWATGLHQANDYFILLDDPDNISIGMSTESLMAERTYRAITTGSDLDSASDVDFTYRGVNLEPLSPVYPVARRAADGGVTLTVQRRSRLSSSWWANGMEAPVGETALALEADVMSGSTVKRTLTSTTGVFTYTAAEQTTDFGAAQDSITFRVYQLSTVVGRGYPLEVSV
jgi:hypothetical protein